MGDGGGGIISSYLLTVENLRFTSRTAAAVSYRPLTLHTVVDC